MSKLFKDVYEPNFIRQLAQTIQEFYPTFQIQPFENQVFDKHWNQKELKARMRHITHTLHQFLTSNYQENTIILQQVLIRFGERKIGNKSLERMIFPDYVQVYGLNDYLFSVNALEIITQFFTAEFAVRPFLEKYPQEMYAQMLQWSIHDNQHVRRLSSEGFRPRLPWGKALTHLKKDPTPILPVLENLMQDESQTVRRSVANNLNDISKDNPQITLQFAKKYINLHPHSDWIVKHACRTLLKKAQPQALQLFGLLHLQKVQILNLEIKTPIVKIGEELKFQFSLQHTENQDTKIRIDYGIDYMKANGKQTQKIFKITENSYSTHQIYSFGRTQSFRQMTTRKHYAGAHQLHIILNGKSVQSIDFEVIH